MVQRPRGTRDFGPAEMALRELVRHRVQDVFATFGYKTIQTPTFEELELFVAKSGPGIVSELYDFQDKGGRHLTLRPELTAPVMRFYHQEHAFDAKPLKWCYFANCFRYDRPQAGRYREFWQYGCELIGAGSPMASAELVALADGVLRAAGLQEFRLAIGHVRVLGAAVDALGLSDEARAQAMRLIDKKDHQGLADHLADAGVQPPAAAAFAALLDARTVADARDRVPAAAADALDELEQCVADLQELGVRVQVDLAIARGLDYYTGIVFEAHVEALGSQSQVLGGGGYDLSQLFGGQATPTMGFGMGFDRVVEAAVVQGGLDAPVPSPTVVLGWMTEEARTQVLRWARALRQAGVRTEVDLLGRKPGKVAEWASSLHARHLVIVGGRELEAEQAQVKRLETGEAEAVPFARLVDHLEGLQGEP